jgi:hypothetical protein
MTDPRAGWQHQKKHIVRPELVLFRLMAKYPASAPARAVFTLLRQWLADHENHLGPMANQALLRHFTGKFDNAMITDSALRAFFRDYDSEIADAIRALAKIADPAFLKQAADTIDGYRSVAEMTTGDPIAVGAPAQDPKRQ